MMSFSNFTEDFERNCSPLITLVFVTYTILIFLITPDDVLREDPLDVAETWSKMVFFKNKKKYTH